MQYTFPTPTPIDYSYLSKLPELFMNSYNTAHKQALEDQLRNDPNAINADGTLNYQAIFKRDPELAIKAMVAEKQIGGVYGTPIYGVDEDGNVVLGAIGKNGKFQKLDTGGVTPTPPQYSFEKGVDPETGLPAVVPMSRQTGQPGGKPILQSGTVPQGYIPQEGAGPEGGPGYTGMPGTPEAFSKHSAT